jgi:hypothetical protein
VSALADMNELDVGGRGRIATILGKYDLVPPGLVSMIEWRPDPDAGPDPLGGDVRRYSAYAAVGMRV